MALSKNYKLRDVVNIILLWLKEDLENELEPNLVKTFINLSTLAEAQKIAETNDVYGKTSNVTESATNVSTSIVNLASYVDATKTITKTTHGLTVADIGKRIILTIPSSRFGITSIASILDANNFLVKDSFGVDVVNVLEYSVLSEHSEQTIDISGLKIMNIVKLQSSIHGEVKKVGDIQADNISRSDFKSEHNLYWYKHGEKIFMVILNGVNVGNLVLFYNTYPDKITNNNDFLDIPDIYILDVIQATKKMCLEHLGIIKYDVSAKVDKNAKRRKAIDTENKTAIDG